MEEKKLKIVLNRNGNGTLNPRCPIPLEWFKKMGLSEKEREINLKFNEQTGELIIKKTK